MKRFWIRMAIGCGLLAAGGASAQLETELVADGLDRPVFITHAPGDAARLFVIEQEGAIRIVKDGVLLPAPFLDIDAKVTGGNSGGDERGLLGLAFSPDYATSGKFYVNYTRSSGGLETIVEEYRVDAGEPDLADAGSGREIITISQPFSNHNGGWIGFGPDGLLYIGMGDGGSSNDPGDRASDLGELLGKMLRLDVSDDSVPYAVPPSNPFVGVGGALDEIWAYGIRNPWRCGFDRDTGDLWIGDVGQNAWEEVNFQPAASAGGEHYGWRCREGLHANTHPDVTGCPPTNPDWVEPVHEYSHAQGCSITGGYVYRGCELGPEYKGKYFFSDYCAGEIKTLDPASGFAVNAEFDTNSNVASFGEDANGELYIATLFDGKLLRLVRLCRADLTGDTVVDSGDLSAFINLFQAVDPAVDFTCDGVVDSGDLALYIQLFLAGC